MYAVALSALLAIGILGALLINTSMQQQARLIAHQQAQIATLQLQTQIAQAQVDRDAAPWVLAQRARELRMRQASSLQVLRAASPSRPHQRTVTGKRARPRKLIRPFHSG